MDKTVVAIIIASDIKGRNKVRFCENLSRRYSLLTKQGFTIHDIIEMPEKMSKKEAVAYVLANTSLLNHADSLSVTEKAQMRFAPKKLSVEAILLRKRKVMSTDEVMNIVESVL